MCLYSFLGAFQWLTVMREARSIVLDLGLSGLSRMARNGMMNNPQLAGSPGWNDAKIRTIWGDLLPRRSYRIQPRV
jgi:hypothetical protein